MIELKDITFNYNREKTTALSDVSGNIFPGLYLLAGENGAGKTTLMHVMAGLSHPQNGVCLIDGVSSRDCSGEYASKVFLLEENMFFPGKTIAEFARIHSRFYPTFSADAFQSNLSAFGLTGREQLRKMSLGNRKKAQLAYVLALGVEVLLLDEPTNALDIEGRNTLRWLLTRSMKPEQTVVVSTHTVGDLEKIFEGAMIMQGSRMLFTGMEDDVTRKLTFRYSTHYEADALYSENCTGRYMNVCMQDGGEPSRVDWRVLYMALHSDNSQKSIVELLKK